jgi:hypothetical protein
MRQFEQDWLELGCRVACSLHYQHPRTSDSSRQPRPSRRVVPDRGSRERHHSGPYVAVVWMRSRVLVGRRAGRPASKAKVDHNDLTESGAVDLQPVATHPPPTPEGKPPRAPVVVPGGSRVEDLHGGHMAVLVSEADTIMRHAEPMATHDRHAGQRFGGDPVHRGVSVGSTTGVGEQHGVDRPVAKHQGRQPRIAGPQAPVARWRRRRAGAVCSQAGQPQGPCQRFGEGSWWRGGPGYWLGRHGRRRGWWCTGRDGWWSRGGEVQQPPGDGQRAQRHQDRKPGPPSAPLHPGRLPTGHRVPVAPPS